MRLAHRPGGIFAAAAVAVLVAACSSGAAGGGGDQGNGPTSSVAEPTEPTEVLHMPTLPPLATPSGVTVQAYKGSIGTYLTDGNGMALYIRTTDSTNKSTCSGSCASAWPPLLLTPGENVQAGTGVSGKLGSFKRSDGSTQVTLNGLPLYYFSGDTAAGQTTGQGLSGVWFLAAPAGGHLTAKPSGSPASSGSGW